MIGLATGLTAIRWAKDLARDAFDFVADRPWQAAAIAAAVWIAWLHFFTIPGKDAQILELDQLVELRTEERDAEIDAHRQTKQDYREAQADAQRLENERFARVETEQQEISDARTASYERRVAAARADAERLRDERDRARAGARGSPDSIPGPGLREAAGGADEAAGGDRLPPGAGTGAGRRDERDWRLIATEQAIQLDELISWVEAQSAIDPNAPPGQAD